MPLGKNVSLSEKLIKRTTGKTSKSNITNNTSKKSDKNKPVKAAPHQENATDGTKKMTFYVKEDLLEKLYNFSYWDRRSVTEAFNLALEDGLKSKNTRETKKA